MSITFSSDQEVEKSIDFLNKLEKPACPGCVRGVAMCYHTPCMGTVDDIEKLIDAGYAKYLMLDWWTGADTTKEIVEGFLGEKSNKKNTKNPFTEDILYLIPAIEGFQGKKAPFAKSGTCNLLINNQCSLHDKGLKPIQGQSACCKIKKVFVDDLNQEHDLDERIPILHTWNTWRGKALIERWSEEVGFFENEEDDLKPVHPKTFPEIMEAILNVLSSQGETRKRQLKSGVPIPTDIVQKRTVIYNKPY